MRRILENDPEPESDSGATAEQMEVALGFSDWSDPGLLAHWLFVVVFAVVAASTGVYYWSHRHHTLIRKRFPPLAITYASLSFLQCLSMFFCTGLALLETTLVYNTVFFVLYHQRTMRVLDRWELLPRKVMHAVLALSAVANVSFFVVHQFIVGVDGEDAPDLTDAQRVFNMVLLLPMAVRIRSLADSAGLKIETTYTISSIIGAELIVRFVSPALPAETEGEFTLWVLAVCLLNVWLISIVGPTYLSHSDNKSKRARSPSAPDLRRELARLLHDEPFKTFVTSRGFGPELRLLRQLGSIGSPIVDSLASKELRPRYEPLLRKGETFEQFVARATEIYGLFSEDLARMFTDVNSIVRRMSVAAQGQGKRRVYASGPPSAGEEGETSGLREDCRWERDSDASTVIMSPALPGRIQMAVPGSVEMV